MHEGRAINARVVDAGDAKVEVDPGDWAILKVKEPIDLPALSLNLGYQFEFADPISASVTITRRASSSPPVTSASARRTDW